jgi:hypothetical protein
MTVMNAHFHAVITLLCLSTVLLFLLILHIIPESWDWNIKMSVMPVCIVVEATFQLVYRWKEKKRYKQSFWS